MKFLITENLPENWNDFFVSQESLLAEIDGKLSEKAKNGEVIFPARENIFKAFSLNSPDKISLVILGQDPYHGEGEAMGLSFSVPKGIKIPPSLRNIFKELHSDLGINNYELAPHGDLTNWANQGIMLLNSTLSVEKDKANSHSKIGWQEFTDNVIKYLSQTGEPKIFVLWGNFAQTKRILIDEKRHEIIESAHPSPLSASRGFFGSKPFSKINEFLKKQRKPEIDWNLR